MSGNKFKVWALDGFRLRHLDYGLYYSDGSFSVGISRAAIHKDDTDNWLFEAGLTTADWLGKEFYGQIFFDRHGRPVAIAIMTPYCFFQRCTWVFEYMEGDRWKWSQEEWYPTNVLSTNIQSITFKKNNVNY